MEKEHKPEDLDQAKDKTEDTQGENEMDVKGDENAIQDEDSGEKNATHSEESDDDIIIEGSDDENTEKVDETQEVEAVDLSMSANLVSPKGTKKKSRLLNTEYWSSVYVHFQ